ncbi:MAG: FAD-binding oxidoreductase [Paracoccaceae bacterium]
MTDDDLAALAAVSETVAVGDDRLAPYLTEPRDRHAARAAVLARPRDTREVAAVLALAHERRLAVIPWGGGTGLVGGQVSGEDAGLPAPVLVSLERLDRIREVSPEDNTVTVEAGVPLQRVQEAAAEAGRLFPLAMASQGSCTIGGNLATNAGGVQVLRYGNARELTLGVEAVMADGTIHHGLRKLRKDNMGYDLRGLLIGSEGTLGIVTAACLKLFARPAERETAMLAVPSPRDALALLNAMRERLGDGITAFELIAAQGPAFLAETHADWRDPLEGAPPWRVLVEATGPDEAGLAERMQAALEAAFADDLATDGIVAASEAQRASLWWVRETIPDANRRIGAVTSNDVSVPLSALSAFIDAAAEAVAAVDPRLRINCFGHVGDGNLHYNAFPPAGAAKADWLHLSDRVAEAVNGAALAHGGSFAAEHGIGRLKRDALARAADPAKLAAMRAIKAALDPRGILNPGAVL